MKRPASKKNFSRRLRREETLRSKLAQASEPCYVIANCAPEGFEAILWVGSDKEKARVALRRSRRVYGDSPCAMYRKKQKDGTYEIECVCDDLGLPPSEIFYH